MSTTINKGIPTIMWNIMISMETTTKTVMTTTTTIIVSTTMMAAKRVYHQ